MPSDLFFTYLPIKVRINITEKFIEGVTIGKQLWIEPHGDHFAFAWLYFIQIRKYMVKIECSNSSKANNH